MAASTGCLPPAAPVTHPCLWPFPPKTAEEMANVIQRCPCRGTSPTPNLLNLQGGFRVLLGWLQTGCSDREGKAAASHQGQGREGVEDGAGNAYAGIIGPFRCKDFPPCSPRPHPLDGRTCAGDWCLPSHPLPCCPLP